MKFGFDSFCIFSVYRVWGVMEHIMTHTKICPYIIFFRNKTEITSKYKRTIFIAWFYNLTHFNRLSVSFYTLRAFFTRILTSMSRITPHYVRERVYFRFYFKYWRRSKSNDVFCAFDYDFRRKKPLKSFSIHTLSESLVQIIQYSSHSC